jgi:hypothetical protein
MSPLDPAPSSSRTLVEDLPPAYYTEAPPTYQDTDSPSPSRASRGDDCSSPPTTESSHNLVNPPSFQDFTDISNDAPQPLEMFHIHVEVSAFNSAPQLLQTPHFPPPVVALPPTNVYTETRRERRCRISALVFISFFLTCCVVAMVVAANFWPKDKDLVSSSERQQSEGQVIGEGCEWVYDC